MGASRGLLVGPSSKDATLHVISWTSQKSKCLTKSVSAAKTLVKCKEIDEGKVIRRTLMEMIGCKSGLKGFDDVKDVYILYNLGSRLLIRIFEQM